MSSPAAKRSYEELEARCAKLEAETGRNLVMQQDLIHAKGQVDSELMRFKAIQAYSAKALHTDDPDEFCSLTLEAVIEAFEFEVALFLRATESEKLLRVAGEFGFDDPPTDLPFSPKWLTSDESEIVGEDDFLLMAWVELDVAKAIVCPFHDKDGNLAGIILGGITKGGMEFFDDIEAHHCSAFTVMVQQAGSLWTNQELNGEIRQQNSRLGNLTDSYSRFVPFQFLELLNRDSIEEIDAGDHVSIETSVLFADIRDFTALSEALGPAGTFAALNEFLVAVEPKVEQAGGFINQYLGDAVMALIPGRADAALSCAIQMIGQSRELNARRSGSGELAIRFGMGISSGPLMLGAIGGGKRLDSNVVGDMPNSEHHGVNFIVAQCSRLFRRLKLGSKREIRHFPAHFFHHHFHCTALAGTWITNIDALALQVREFRDAAIRAGDDGEWLWVHREDGPQFLECAIRELFWRRAVITMILPIGLGYAHVQITGSDTIDVLRGTARRMGAFNVVGLGTPIDQFTNSATDLIVNAGLTAGTNSDELLRRLGANEAAGHEAGGRED